MWPAPVVAYDGGRGFIKPSTLAKSRSTLRCRLYGDVRAIREYVDTPVCCGIQTIAGGIRTAKQSLDCLSLMKESLDRKVVASLFRLGASSMLADIERQLEYFAREDIRRG